MDEKCFGCERAAEEQSGMFNTCLECQSILIAMLAAMKPGELKPGAKLSAQRRMHLLKIQQMVRDLADTSIAFADPGYPDARLARAIETVEGMWAVFSRPLVGSNKKLRDLLN